MHAFFCKNVSISLGRNSYLGKLGRKQPWALKNFPKNSKIWDNFLFPPQIWEILPNFTVLGKENPQIIGATRHFWSIFDVAPRRAAKNPGRKQISGYLGWGKKQDLWPKY